jgi:hypothetical protein
VNNPSIAGLPPLLRDQRKIDADHLHLLGVLHFVLAGLAVIGLGFLFLHYTLMQSLLSNPEMWKNQQGGGPPPKEFFAIFKWFYLIFGVGLSAGGLGNVLSGIFIWKKKHRIFSLVVAGLNCIQFPFGTALGVFSFIVLYRDSVCESYESSEGVTSQSFRA